MSQAPAPAEESPNPYEAYYLEQAAMLSIPDSPANPRGRRRDLESFRLAPMLAPEVEQTPELRGREIVKVILGIVILVVIPLVVAAVYWRTSTFGG